MSDAFETWITGQDPKVNSGSGDQYNFTLLKDLGLKARKSGPRLIAEDDLGHELEGFVYPEGLGYARRLLQARHTVVLTGPPGAGKRTAALKLLHELRGSGGVCRELLDQTTEDSAQPALDPVDVDQHDRLLLDLSDGDEIWQSRVLDELSGFRHQVLEHDAYLVVVLPVAGTSHRLRNDARSLTAELHRPSGTAVFRARLRVRDVLASDEEMRAGELTDYLEAARATEHVVRLADLIELAKRRQPNQDFAAWLTSALASVADHSEKVADVVAESRTASRRALLLALAYFHGTRADAVHSATRALLRMVGQREEEGVTPLEHRDLKEQLRTADATLDARRHVSFVTDGYDVAVREHFWDFLPHLRPRLRDWVDAGIELPMLSKEEQAAVAERLAEQYVRTSKSDELFRLVEQWTSARRRGLRQATAILRLGLDHPAHRRAVWAAIYNWSRRENLGKELTVILVGVCSEVLAERHPDRALVRLHHLARHEREAAPGAATSALIALAHSENRLYRRLLQRLVTGLANDNWRAADTRLFLMLADPRLLIDTTRRSRPLLSDTVVREQVTAGWGYVLAHGQVSFAETRLRDWLDTALDQHRHRDALLGTMVDACDGRAGPLGGLLLLTLRWSTDGTGTLPERRRIANLLRRRIDTAQGIAFAPSRG
ncbi:hypothetical protein ABZ832_15735 [Streptantibioticus parmotrematis]|uniref:hypothetical protein n=1 Tax=Streptantibioticus parmotrematis TaxID=2873249 RepID=UPI0033DF6250